MSPSVSVPVAESVAENGADPIAVGVIRSWVQEGGIFVKPFVIVDVGVIDVAGEIPTPVWAIVISKGTD